MGVIRRTAVAATLVTALVGGGLLAGSAAASATGVTAADCHWDNAAFADGARIRNAPSFNATVLGLAYSSHHGSVYSCPTVTDTVWLQVNDTTTGVSGWTQQGLAWQA